MMMNNNKQSTQISDFDFDFRIFEGGGVLTANGSNYLLPHLFYYFLKVIYLVLDHWEYISSSDECYRNAKYAPQLGW